jgi:hypothetical protein
MGARKNGSKQLLYYQNINRAETAVNWFVGIAWLVCVALNLIHIFTGNIADNMNHNTYLPLISLTFVSV